MTSDLQIFMTEVDFGTGHFSADFLASFEVLSF